MCRIYEDIILEKIPNTRYEILNNQYETEQRELNKEIDGLEKAIKRKENGKQKEYEERYKARREEKKQEKLKVLKRVGIPVSEYRKIIKKNTI